MARFASKVGTARSGTVLHEGGLLGYNYLRQHCPAVWAEFLARGNGPLL